MEETPLFNPLYAHLDSSIETSITTDSDDIVSVWLDQTNNSLNATKAGGVGDVYYPSTSLNNNLTNGLLFGEDNAEKTTLNWFSEAQQKAWLDFSSGSEALAVNDPGFAMFVVVTPIYAFLDGTEGNIIVSNVREKFSLRYDTDGRSIIHLGGSGGGNTIFGAVDTLSINATVVLAVNYNATTEKLTLWDSKNKTISSPLTINRADFSSEEGMFIGGSSNASEFMEGIVSEIKLYNRSLGNSVFESIGVGLEQKWVASSGGGGGSGGGGSGGGGSGGGDFDVTLGDVTIPATPRNGIFIANADNVLSVIQANNEQDNDIKELERLQIGMTKLLNNSNKIQRVIDRDRSRSELTAGIETINSDVQVEQQNIDRVMILRSIINQRKGLSTPSLAVPTTESDISSNEFSDGERENALNSIMQNTYINYSSNNRLNRSRTL